MSTVKEYLAEMLKEVNDCQFRCELAKKHIGHLQEMKERELEGVKLAELKKLTEQSNQCMYQAQQYMFETLIGNKELANKFWIKD